jgi:hypothetical protein
MLRFSISRFAVAGLLAIVISTVNAVGIYLEVAFNNNAPLSAALIATALFTFVSLLGLMQPANGSWQISEPIMRTVIAGTVVIEYLVLIATVAFFQQGDSLPEITKTMISSFTTIVGVVIAFYFGTSAITEALRRSRQTPSEMSSRSDIGGGNDPSGDSKTVAPSTA